MEILCPKCGEVENIVISENEDDTIFCWCICSHTWTTFITENEE